MANELVHGSVGTGMTQAEFEAVGLHVLNSQATGDVIYASSATQLSRLGIGATNAVLTVIGGVPTWQTTLAGLTLTAPVINGTVTTTGLTFPAFTLGGTITGAAQILSNLGKTYIGDTADANVTLGLVINQAGNDDAIQSMKSSDVAHGITDTAETDTFGQFTKAVAASGGVQLRGLSSASIAMYLTAYGTTDNTAKTTAAVGYITCYIGTKSGTTVTNPGANANLLTIGSLGTTRFIFDVEGDGYYDGSWNLYADYNDLALIQDIEQELSARDGEAKTARRHALEDMGIIGKNSWHRENGKLRAMINGTRLVQLHHGALLQLHERLNQIENRLQLVGG